MNPKIVSILEKASKEKSRGGHSKALKRITDAIEEYPLEFELYKEAIGLGLEAGEPLHTIKYFKRALSRFAADKDLLNEFALELEKKTGDPVFGKYLLEQSIKNKNLQEAYRVVQAISEHTQKDLLLRTRKKRETLSSALRGGHTLDSEIVINETSEALLNLALENLREAVQIFIQHMDSKIVKSELWEPLLLDMESLNPKNGYIRYALGSCYLSRADIDRGIQKIALAIKLNPELVDDITRRLELTTGKDSSSHESLKVALLEAYSLQGNTSKFTPLAQSILDENPQKSSQVLDLLKKHIEKNTTDWELDEFYLDASLRSKQTNRIRYYLQKTWEEKDKRRNNLDWLESRAKSGVLPADLQIYFGKLVLDEGRTDWAINIFKRTASASPAEVQNIIHILDKRKQTEPQVEEFCEELKRSRQESTAVGEFDIQCIENSEFSLSKFEEDSEEEKLEVEDSTYAPGAIRGRTQSTFSPSDLVSLNDLADRDPQQSRESHDPSAAESEKSEPCKCSGAEQTCMESKSESKADRPVEPPQNHGMQILTTESEHAVSDFSSRFQDSKNGELDNDAILDSIEAALDRGRLDEAKSLLDFHPVTIREEVKRILCLADYYLYLDQPLPALIALKSFDTNALNRREKRDYLTRMAASYRALKMFEAAHCTYIRLMNDEPSDTQLALLAKTNYEDYLNERCEGALILEKVCFLNNRGTKEE